MYGHRLSQHPQDHPRQRYADRRITFVSLLFEDKGGGEGRQSLFQRGFRFSGALARAKRASGAPWVKNLVIYASTLSCKLGEISIDVPLSTKKEPLSYFYTFIEKWCPSNFLNK